MSSQSSASSQISSTDEETTRKLSCCVSTRMSSKKCQHILSSWMKNTTYQRTYHRIHVTLESDSLWHFFRYWTCLPLCMCCIASLWGCISATAEWNLRGRGSRSTCLGESCLSYLALSAEGDRHHGVGTEREDRVKQIAVGFVRSKTEK